MKKRVERSSDDPTTVVTTYEGQHIHPSPATPRGSIGIAPMDSGSGFISSVAATASVVPFGVPQMQPPYQQQQHSYIYSSPPSLNMISSSNSTGFNSPNSLAAFVQERRNNINGYVPSSANSSLLRDHGLLEDIVPTQMRKEQKDDLNQ